MAMALKSRDLALIFKGLDQNGDGLVTVDELNWLLRQIGVPCISSEELVLSAGKSGLNLDEFGSFYASITRTNCVKIDVEEDGGEVEVEEDEDLVEAFNVFDLDKDGFICSKELEQVLAKLGLWKEEEEEGKGNGKDAAAMIRKYDANSDGLIDLDEFKQMIFQSS